MSTQPYSRADRNRIRAAFRAGKNGLIVVAIDETAGSITVESEAYLCARLRAGRPMRRPARIAPPKRLDAVPLTDDGVVRNFVRGPSYERLPDGEWVVHVFPEANP